MRPALVLLPCVLLALACPAAAAPDEELLGKSEGYPIGTRANWFFDERVRVGSFSNLDNILPHYTLAKAATPLPLPKAAGAPKIEYSFENQTLSLDDFLAHQRVTGFLLIKDGKVLDERYQYDRNRGTSIRFALDGEIDRQYRDRDGTGREEDRFTRRHDFQIRAETGRQSLWRDHDTQHAADVVRRAVQRGL